MTLLSVKGIDFSAHEKYYSEPLMGALRVLASDNEDLCINGQRVPYHVRQRTAREYFGVLLQACDRGGFSLPTASVHQIDSVIAADNAFNPQKCSWTVATQRHHAFKKGNVQKQVFDILAKLFSYKKFTEGIGWKFEGNCIKPVNLHDLGVAWGSDEYLSKLIRINRLRFCPYCNAETIFFLNGLTNRKGKSLSPFDHFYPDAPFPYLGVSVFNLIPCCAHCNSSMKGDKLPMSKMGRWPNPYADDFNCLAKFKYQSDPLLALLGATTADLKVNFDFNVHHNVPDVQAFVKVMNILEKYNQSYHVEINELPEKLSCIFRQAPNLVEDLFGTGKSASLVRYVLNCSLDDREIHYERLSKMNLDLIEDLGCMQALLCLVNQNASALAT